MWKTGVKSLTLHYGAEITLAVGYTAESSCCGLLWSAFGKEEQGEGKKRNADPKMTVLRLGATERKTEGVGDGMRRRTNCGLATAEAILPISQ